MQGRPDMARPDTSDAADADPRVQADDRPVGKVQVSVRA
jgi:hypothetical protein